MPTGILMAGAAVFLVGVGVYFSHHLLATVCLLGFGALFLMIGGALWSLSSFGDISFS